ncbi:DAK2 domain-containing protein, partial [Mycobacterium sp.]|uniref:DAK2 domain-containing protein n=1 Tax=Mycobacterium sp. TaxID=1785 RepID=UPI003A89824F
GLGIHGEPGVDETGIPTADHLAELLVEQLLTEVPDGVETKSARVVPILNGLGSLKYEEMFVVYRRIASLLEDAGVEVVDPHVGEYCTSFDMAGTSLTLFWLDDELHTLWDTAVDTSAYRRGSVAPQLRIEPIPAASADAEVFEPSDDESQDAARIVLAAVRAIAETVDEHVDELGRIDAIAGDGDHGIGMQRGSHAALHAASSAVEAGAGAKATLAHAADAWANKAGGTSGALWGVILNAVAAKLSNLGTPDPAVVIAGVADATYSVTAYGKAEVGDKTMVDALVPFSSTLTQDFDGGASLVDAWHTAAAAATLAAQATTQMLPRMGRSRTHGHNSVGTPDPGAISLALIVNAVGDLLTAECQKESAHG